MPMLLLPNSDRVNFLALIFWPHFFPSCCLHPLQDCHHSRGRDVIVLGKQQIVLPFPPGQHSYAIHRLGLAAWLLISISRPLCDN